MSTDVYEVTIHEIKNQKRIIKLLVLGSSKSMANGCKVQSHSWHPTKH